MIKKQPPLVSDDLRACPHFPSIPDSKRDQAQAKALSEPWAVKEGKREDLVLGRSRKKPEAGKPKLQLQPLVLRGLRCLF